MALLTSFDMQFAPNAQRSAVTAMPITAANIARQEAQPNAFKAPPMTNCFMTFRLDAISIRITMTGTETIPLMTALQNKA
ncbi:hypothetical protein, partial [Rhizobium sp. Pop5]|uniref:hypothetical protein n=1 Tax=Rhizobium sp. Pop5 TaxID=1223565 RepID=UPI001969B558